MNAHDDTSYTRAPRSRLSVSRSFPLTEYSQWHDERRWLIYPSLFIRPRAWETRIRKKGLYLRVWPPCHSSSGQWKCFSSHNDVNSDNSYWLSFSFLHITHNIIPHWHTSQKHVKQPCGYTRACVFFYRAKIYGIRSAIAVVALARKERKDGTMF